MASYPKINYMSMVAFQGSTAATMTVDPNIQSAASLVSDIAAWKASGRVMVLMVPNGGGVNATFVSAADIFGAVSSISAAVKQYGFQGIDWDIEGGEGTYTASAIASINSQLKALFPGFLIIQSPRPYELRNGGGQKRAMAQSGGYDLISPQYYFNQTDFNAVLVSDLADFTSNGIVKPTQFVFGIWPSEAGGTDGSSATSTTAQCLTWYEQIKKTYPTIRGASLWESENLAATNFAGLFAPIVL